MHFLEEVCLTRPAVRGDGKGGRMASSLKTETEKKRAAVSHLTGTSCELA